MAVLNNTLGGLAGFGENALASDERWSFTAIDLSGFYNPTSGLKFLGNFYSALWVNQDGFIQFRPADGGRAELSSVPRPGPGAGVLDPATSGDNIAPIIAASWSPVDTTLAALPPPAFGNATGANRVWYDRDETTGAITVTWDSVQPESGGPSEVGDAAGRNSFQLRIAPATNLGATSIDFDVTFRFETMEWPTFT